MYSVCGGEQIGRVLLSLYSCTKGRNCRDVFWAFFPISFFQKEGILLSLMYPVQRKYNYLQVSHIQMEHCQFLYSSPCIFTNSSINN